ncbi:G-D-S-L family lipolytic protein [Tenacibaculum sp. 190524A05c]|uniref:G-D-S-L family lipolytic protein n=1 Tax=Tenacibaculum platacis TaxID=3137852 RepID=UPI0031FABCAB
MKKFKLKYSWLPIALLGLTACDINNELEAIPEVETPVVAVDATGLDLSNYVAVGASFSAGFTDNALFIAAQENSFPNIISQKFQLAGGGDFVQPLMNDNIGGLLFGGNMIQGPRLYFNGSGPASLAALGAVPTTEVTTKLPSNNNNYGIPGAKSYHFVAPGYGSLNAVPLGQANPYFARISSSETATVLGDAVANAPTFFTLSEIGGNDVLGYALGGGAGVDQTGNMNPATYGPADITDPTAFAGILTQMVDALTANGAKGVVGNIPYITSLSHFTTVPHNPIPLDAATAGAVNQAYAAYNQGLQGVLDAKNAGLLPAQVIALLDQAGFDQAEVDRRQITFAEGTSNAVVIMDEDLTDLSIVNPALTNMRQATADDLLVLTSSSFIGTLADPSNPLSVNGVAVPLADKWVLTPEEQNNIRVATDSYNATLKAVADGKGLGFVDFNAILQQAATTGLTFGDFTMTTSLVTGGLVSLDGVHLTARGYGLMANEFLKATDATYGSNFGVATDGLSDANDLPTNYSPTLR